MAATEHRGPVTVPTPTQPGSPVRNDDSRIAGAAADGTVVHRTGNETIQGQKTIPAGAGNEWAFNQPVQVAQGTQGYHAMRRDDPTRTDARAPTAHASSHAGGGSDVLTPGDIGAAPAGHSHGASAPAAHASSHRADGSDPIAPAPRVVAFSAAQSVAAAAGVDLDRVNITATAAMTSLTITGGYDGQRVEVVVLGSGAARNVTIAAAMGISTGVTRGPYAVASGQVGIFLFRYSTLLGKFALVAATVTA